MLGYWSQARHMERNPLRRPHTLIKIDLTPTKPRVVCSVARWFSLTLLAWERGVGCVLGGFVQFGTRKDGTQHLTDLQHPTLHSLALSQGVQR